METREAETIRIISDQFKFVLTSSEQPVCIYLDDEHKVCNYRFAALLGYGSPEEWARVTHSFPIAFIEPESRETFSTNSTKVREKFLAAEFQVVWKKKPGGKAKKRSLWCRFLNQK